MLTDSDYQSKVLQFFNHIVVNKMAILFWGRVLLMCFFFNPRGHVTARPLFSNAMFTAHLHHFQLAATVTYSEYIH